MTSSCLRELYNTSLVLWHSAVCIGKTESDEDIISKTSGLPVPPGSGHGSRNPLRSVENAGNHPATSRDLWCFPQPFVHPASSPEASRNHDKRRQDTIQTGNAFLHSAPVRHVQSMPETELSSPRVVLLLPRWQGATGGTALLFP